METTRQVLFIFNLGALLQPTTLRLLISAVAQVSRRPCQELRPPAVCAQVSNAVERDLGGQQGTQGREKREHDAWGQHQVQYVEEKSRRGFIIRGEQNLFGGETG